MNCQSYREWIEETALGAIAGPIDASRRVQLHAHLAACPECRRAFEAAQKLYAAIDRGVAARVEGMPPGNFAARVRMRLADESERAEVRFWWRPAIWIPALGTAALALLLLTIWIARRPGEQRSQPPRQQATQTALSKPESPVSVKPSEQASVTRPPSAWSARRPSPASPRRGAACCGPDSGAPQLQVQIQPGQWAAVTSLYRAGQSGKVNETAEDVPADQPLRVTPVEVPPLVVAELQDPKPVGSEPENTNVQDR
jgi:anti-sigma factor RsiW